MNSRAMILDPPGQLRRGDIDFATEPTATALGAFGTFRAITLRFPHLERQLPRLRVLEGWRPSIPDVAPDLPEATRHARFFLREGWLLLLGLLWGGFPAAGLLLVGLTLLVGWLVGPWVTRALGRRG